MPDALMGPLFYNLDPMSCKNAGYIACFAAQKTGENKPFFNKKTPVGDQPAHDIIMDVGNYKVRRI